ncbi:hypothetical protein [Shouchella lonarensis]|uniref:Uncharacterized protein n=1 Tax=Shouchella lonarensis TaxID=1464122 RepID=A0A1G6GHP2_9BACI|nr:hypothetical protein [Shouchella lonarensis]SDB81470.1 hypothetical protein SAMN05421737_10172 [Shouchella lonarensis]
MDYKVVNIQTYFCFLQEESADHVIDFNQPERYFVQISDPKVSDILRSE